MNGWNLADAYTHDYGWDRWRYLYIPFVAGWMGLIQPEIERPALRYSRNCTVLR
jgi:hypothetical protein